MNVENRRTFFFAYPVHKETKFMKFIMFMRFNDFSELRKVGHELHMNIG